MYYYYYYYYYYCDNSERFKLNIRAGKKKSTPAHDSSGARTGSQTPTSLSPVGKQMYRDDHALSSSVPTKLPRAFSHGKSKLRQLQGSVTIIIYKIV